MTPVFPKSQQIASIYSMAALCIVAVVIHCSIPGYITDNNVITAYVTAVLDK